jgi:hypothetical protein
VQDEHHIYVIVDPFVANNDFSKEVFEGTSATKAFEAGNEWTIDLRKTFIVTIPPEKRKYKWITTEPDWRTVLKIHMKLES